MRSVGAGRVTMASWKGGGGKTIKIRHNSKYATAYKHLSRYARGIRRGSKVEQGQIIGYVGSTGMSTGPHLHFEFYERGRYVDPLGIKFPRDASLSRSKMTQFTDRARELLAFFLLTSATGKLLATLK